MHSGIFSRSSLLLAIIVGVLFNIGSSEKIGTESFVVFCDVGQGDASYIHINPNLDVLIDTGKDSSVENCIRKNNSKFDGVFEAIFISHLHADHVGGLNSLLRRYSCGTLYINMTEAVKPPNLHPSELKQSCLTSEPAIQGDVIEIGELTFTVLWPPKDLQYASNSISDKNLQSQIIRARYKDRAILYTGDISAEWWLRRVDQPKIKSDILKVPHHGSRQGLNQQFILLADPTTAVISSGKRNSYGHPSPVTLDLLKRNHIQVLRTDELGDVKILLE